MVIWLKIPTSPVVRGGAVLAVPSAPWRTMRGSLPRTGGASAGASGEGTISMRQHPCVSGCMSPCVSGGIGKSGGISMYWIGSSVCASTHSWINWASHGGIVSGVAAGVTWAVLSVCVVPSAVVASWAAWLQHGSGLVLCGIVLLVVWSAAGFTPEVAWLASRSELALCGLVLLRDGCRPCSSRGPWQSPVRAVLAVPVVVVPAARLRLLAVRGSCLLCLRKVGCCRKSPTGVCGG